MSKPGPSKDKKDLMHFALQSIIAQIDKEREHLQMLEIKFEETRLSNVREKIAKMINTSRLSLDQLEKAREEYEQEIMT